MNPQLSMASTKERNATRRRLRVSALALGDYGVAISIMAIYVLLGLVELRNLLLMTGLALLIGGGFIALMASGWTRNLADPALTGSQVACAAAFNLTCVAMFPQLNLIVFIFGFIGMSYAALALTSRIFSAIWALYIAGLAWLIFFTGLTLQVPLETNWQRTVCVLSVLIVTSRFLAVTAYVSGQRDKLRQQKNDLAQSSSALEQARGQLYLILQTLPVGVLAYQGDGCIRLINHVASASLEQLFGEPDWDRLRTRLDPSHMKRLQHGGAALGEREVAGINGHRFLVKLAELKGDGNSTDTILVFWDVTQQRRVEFEREQALAFLSHDLRAPLSSISARLSNPALDLNEQRGGIASDLQRAMSLTEDFLMLAKTERFKGKELRSIDLVEVTQEAVLATESIVSQSAIELDLRVQNEGIMVRGDWVLLVRAVVNIIINAIRHSPRSSRIQIRLHVLAGQEAYVDVQDSGPGFKEDIMSLVNNPGKVRIINSADRRSVGLGLLLVKEVMALHRGNLSVRHSAEGGALVRLTLPMNRPA